MHSLLGFHVIWQLLLENKTLDLQTAYTWATALDLDKDLYATPDINVKIPLNL